MAKSDLKNHHDVVWRESLLQAFPFIASYFSPYALENIPISPEKADTESAVTFFRLRFELARATIALEILDQAQHNLTTMRRHAVSYSSSDLRGVVDVPRYLHERANGLPRGVPTISANKHLGTPENLLVSEVITHIRSLRRWALPHTSSEANEIRRIERASNLFEAAGELNRIRDLPRPSLSDLCKTVLDQAVAGILLNKHPAVQLARLFHENPEKNPELVSETVRAFVRVVSDPNARDKLFEIIVLNWISSALQSLGRGVVHYDRLSRSGHDAICECTLNGTNIEVYYQTSKPLPPAKYATKSGNKVRGIPDILIKVGSAPNVRIILVDPKCRVPSSETEVVYKLLGYKENFYDTVYHGIAVFPDFGEGSYVKTYRDQEQNTVTLIRSPLDRGQMITKRFARNISTSPKLRPSS